jgi:hypothetical protein
MSTATSLLTGMVLPSFVFLCIKVARYLFTHFPTTFFNDMCTFLTETIHHRCMTFTSIIIFLFVKILTLIYMSDLGHDGSKYCRDRAYHLPYQTVEQLVVSFQ